MNSPALPTTPDSAALWSAFWRTGAREGCTMAFPPAAQQAIVSGWRAAFANRPPETRLLDIACGRGAVMALAAAAGLASRTGVDIAATDAIAIGGERILGGIDARALPFEDRAFDLVVSQFGLEYAGLDAALDEAARVTRGDLVLLFHAADGAVVTQAAEQARHAAWIDAELKGFEALSQGGAVLDSVLAKVLAAARTAANTAMLEGYYHTARALAARPDPAMIAGFAAEWRDHAGRMADLARAAPDRGAAHAAVTTLERQGFAAKLSDLAVDGALVGRWLSARRI